MNNKLVIIGAGEHARKIWHYATSLGLSVSAFVDDRPQAISPIPSIPCLTVQNANCFESGQRYVVAIGKAAVRRRLQEEFESKGWLPMSLIHPTAYVAPDVVIGAGCVICAQVVVETGSVIGVGTIVDVGSIVDHDCVVGAYCHLKAGCLLQSHTTVGDEKVLPV
jgi:sugar O-acyltransferase (sialic acid O-acetyltransferase NeuD family)